MSQDNRITQYTQYKIISTMTALRLTIINNTTLCWQGSIQFYPTNNNNLNDPLDTFFLGSIPQPIQQNNMYNAINSSQTEIFR